MKIELRGVLKAYRSVRALDYVSLTIDPGQIISILGHGCFYNSNHIDMMGASQRSIQLGMPRR